VWEQAGYSHEHIASQITPDRIERSDLVLVMDSSNHANVLEIAKPLDHRKVYFLRDFDPLAEDLEVPDPYGLGDHAFETVLEMVERSVDGLLNALGVANPSDTSR
jgi:protein-tyrosine phosphatase